MYDPATPSTAEDALNPQPLPPVAYGEVPPPQDEYDAVPPQSQGERVANTFFSPSKTFADIRRNRSWWLPFLLLTVFGLTFGALAAHRVGPQTLAENTLRADPAQAEKMQNMPAEQRASVMKFTAISMQVGLFGTPVFLLLWNAFLALLLWVGCNFILGGRSTYPGMFAVSFYAGLPALLAYVVLIVTVLVGDPESFNLANPAGTNLGYYLPQGTSVVLVKLLSSIDVFTIWTCFLLGLGSAIVARIKPAKGLALVFGTWIVIVLIKVGYAAAMS